MRSIQKSMPLIIVVACILSACQFTTSYSNREGDKEDAKKVTDAFYADLKTGKIDSVYPIFGSQFYDVSPKDSLTKMITSVTEKCGEIRADSILDWQTKITRGTTNEADYDLTYAVTRSKHNSKEEIHLVKEPDGKIKIVGYHINY